MQLTYAGVQSGNLKLNDFEGLRRYFWQTVHDGKLESYLSYRNEQGEFVGISPVRAVYDSNGKLLGVLNINITLMRIKEFLKNLYISPHGQSFIMERSGDLVVSSTIAEPFVVKGEGDDREIERIPAAYSQNAMLTVTTGYLQKYFGNLNAINKGQ